MLQVIVLCYRCLLYVTDGLSGRAADERHEDVDVRRRSRSADAAAQC